MVNLLQARSNDVDNVSKLNAANVFTFARLPLAFVGMWVFNRSPLWGIVIIALAALTDFFDGLVARRFNCVTEFGRRLDPAVDKTFMLIVLIFTLVKMGASAGAVILWAIIVVELMIAAASFKVWRLTGLTVRVVTTGKYGMFLRMVAVTLLLLSTALPSDLLEVTLWTTLITGGAGVAFGLLAWTDYLVQAKFGPTPL